ncbi:MAG: MinD/ParA family protein [Anaerolineae bacterium]|nr:MinD/ParA family protein [Ardenticatenia bacterium]MBK8540778.1 MinD/ParA family protein [Ardenticatenia bacterium]HQZ71779.1 MinD/ParA family protein [Anaerolineae bacterium]HRA20041.1 MinD/ParA family protein [Anaerolineae bacterium]
MPAIVSIHSFRGGTGKSTITASTAVLTARRGYRVAVVDTDIQSPGIHVLFGLSDALDQGGTTLNDFLWGRATILDAAHEVPVAGAGSLHVVPGSIKTVEIAKVLKEGYDVGRLNEGFRDLISGLNLDVLFIDTHPGLNEETLLSIAISDLLFLVLRPDQQDYQGTGVTVEVARRLGVPDLQLVLNKVPASFDLEQVRSSVETAYGSPAAAVLLQSEAMMQLSSRDVFVQAHPDDALSRELGRLADLVAALIDSGGNGDALL